jgi:prepilin-type N-terminal cleavage/methylation domain-containing protein
MGLEMSQATIADLTAQSQHKPKTSGFTLVELSIVLVIIGLIVGGVVGGQSLIKSAKITDLVSTIKETKVAVRAFDLQYDALPGDMANASDYWPTASNGDGNRQYTSAEAALVGSHLVFANIMQKKQADWSYDAEQYNGGQLQMQNYDLGFGARNYIVYGKPNNNGAGPHFFNSTISPVDAKVVDTKLDDGASASGKVIGRSGQDSTTLCDGVGWNASPSGDYILSQANETCFIVIKIE